jgi:hypothetical protein
VIAWPSAARAEHAAGLIADQRGGAGLPAIHSQKKSHGLSLRLYQSALAGAYWEEVSGMFEHYTQEARRTVFFSRFEASKMGAAQIETEHLLLGILREDPVLRAKLPTGAERLRARIAQSAPPPAERISTSVDLPLSPDCRRALSYAANESAALEHKSIDCGHLLLGLLRVETSTAAIILREFGIEYASYREVVAKPPVAPEPDTDPAAVHERVAAAPLREAAAGLRRMLAVAMIRHEHPRGQCLKRTGWTRKEALGHLIDWAAAHQQWFARALAEPKLTARRLSRRYLAGGAALQRIAMAWIGGDVGLAEPPDPARDFSHPGGKAGHPLPHRDRRTHPLAGTRAPLRRVRGRYCGPAHDAQVTWLETHKKTGGHLGPRPGKGSSADCSVSFCEPGFLRAGC